MNMLIISLGCKTYFHSNILHYFDVFAKLIKSIIQIIKKKKKKK
jgi:hypothetical protein